MILVFVGAGGSAAVDPEQYPTTRRFFEKLPEEIKENRLFVRVKEFIRKTKENGEPIDIEEMLWNLDSIQEYFLAPTRPETPIGWVMEKDFFRKFFGAHNKADEFLGELSRLENQVALLVSQINRQVYELYAALPSEPQKVWNWVNLLTELVQVDPVLEIFTTNYDRLLEYVLEQAKLNTEFNIATGQYHRLGRLELDWDRWDSFDLDFPGDNHGLLTQLHGSVNWHREGQRIVIGPSRFTGSDNNHAIVYPGNKGEPREEPFRIFHEHLGAVVSQVRAAIFVGFSFRDDYINKVLADLPSNIPVFVFHKYEGDLLGSGAAPFVPFSTPFAHDGGGFTEESAKRCISYLHEQINPPLDTSRLVTPHPEITRP